MYEVDETIKGVLYDICATLAEHLCNHVRKSSADSQAKHSNGNSYQISSSDKNLNRPHSTIQQIAETSFSGFKVGVGGHLRPAFNYRTCDTDSHIQTEIDFQVKFDFSLIKHAVVISETIFLSFA